MTLWKAWSDTRQKFYLCAVLVTLLMLPGTITLAVRSAQAVSQTAVAAAADPELQGSAEAFSRSVENWTHGSALGIFSALAVVLGVGGTMTRASARSNLMTLSLPERRSRWLIAQWLVAIGLLLVLTLWEATILLVAGLVSGLGASFGDLAVAAVLTGLCASFWIWPAILGTALTRDAVRAGLVVISLMVAVGTLTPLLGLDEWSLRTVADITRWRGDLPWKGLLVGLVASTLTAYLALRLFERTEY